MIWTSVFTHVDQLSFIKVHYVMVTPVKMFYSVLQASALENITVSEAVIVINDDVHLISK